MNLQVCVPYQPCKYHCPMCIARGHRHEYKFDNLYATDKKKYLELLIEAVKSIGDGNVILTGECDPTQDMPFLRDVIKSIRKACPKTKIELQTRNYQYSGELDIDVLSYSITCLRDYLNSWSWYKYPKRLKVVNRIVILLVDEFKCLNNNTFDAMGYDQVTFKTLQLGENEIVNRWIKANSLDDVYCRDIENIVRTGVSIRFDTNCQQATGRYLIFRSDGKIYESWETDKERGK